MAMKYPLTTITELTNSNYTVNSTNSFFLILEEDDEVIINNEVSKVNVVSSDTEFSVKTAFTDWTSGEYVYTTSKCVYLKYNLWKVETAINNYNLRAIGIKKLESDDERVEYMDTTTSIQQLESLRDSLQSQLNNCEAEASGEDIWVQRRYEYGTL